MPDRERDTAIKRLRRAAENVLAAQRSRRLAFATDGLYPTPGCSTVAYIREDNALLALSDAWRNFPECERDQRVPSAEEVLKLCDDYDRQKEEAERIADGISQ